MDEIDIKIIELLRNDGKITLRELKNVIGISEPAIQKRINKLVEEGIIKKFTVEIDEKKIGYSISSFLGIDTDPESFIEVQNKLKEMPEIRKLYLTSGEHSIIAYVECRDQREFSELVSNKLSSIRGVKRIYPSIILEKLK